MSSCHRPYDRGLARPVFVTSHLAAATLSFPPMNLELITYLKKQSQFTPVAALEEQLKLDRDQVFTDVEEAIEEGYSIEFHPYLGFKLIDRHYCVDQTHLKRFFSAVLAAQIPDFARFLLADDTRQIAGA